MRIIIPSIKVNAVIQNLGVLQSGEMAVPTNFIDAGWFHLGPRPGEKGSAVIAGHLNGEHGEAGVFANLDKLSKGDTIYTKDAKGNLVGFVVKEKRTYNPGFAEEVFNQTDAAHLNLVTCDGSWDKSIKSYTKRLVVFADIFTPQEVP